VDIGRIDRSRQEKSRLEERLVTNRLQQLFEFHGGKLPNMASCCNGLFILHGFCACFIPAR
jgi:hypothetical protein